MPVRGLLAGAVIFAVLAGAVWWSETKNKKDDTTAAAKSDSPKLVSLKDDDVTRVEIKQKDSEQPVVLQRGKSGWTMSSPRQVSTDSDAVNSVVSSVTGLTWDRLVDEK